MVKNRKLAKQISQIAWGQFLNLLEYKGKLYGCKIYRVDKFFPSSKRCSRCGYIKEDLTLKEREWNCLECQTHQRNMKNRLMRLHDKLLSRYSSIVETIIPQLNNISQIEHSRHRSPVNFCVNLLCGLIAYCHQPKKPSLQMDWALPTSA